jgi:uncharacterized protein YodC (DUF2158 family)
MSDFKPGNAVALVSGGPRMTVSRVSEGGMVECYWFLTDNTSMRDEFPEAVLAHVEPEWAETNPGTPAPDGQPLPPVTTIEYVRPAPQAEEGAPTGQESSN